MPPDTTEMKVRLKIGEKTDSPHKYKKPVEGRKFNSRQAGWGRGLLMYYRSRRGKKDKKYTLLPSVRRRKGVWHLQLENRKWPRIEAARGKNISWGKCRGLGGYVFYIKSPGRKEGDHRQSLERKFYHRMEHWIRLNQELSLNTRRGQQFIRGGGGGDEGSDAEFRRNKGRTPIHMKRERGLIRHHKKRGNSTSSLWFY